MEHILEEIATRYNFVKTWFLDQPQELQVIYISSVLLVLLIIIGLIRNHSSKGKNGSDLSLQGGITYDGENDLQSRLKAERERISIMTPEKAKTTILKALEEKTILIARDAHQQICNVVIENYHKMKRRSLTISCPLSLKRLEFYISEHKELENYRADELYKICNKINVNFYPVHHEGGSGAFSSEFSGHYVKVFETELKKLCMNDNIKILSFYSKDRNGSEIPGYSFVRIKYRDNK